MSNYKIFNMKKPIIFLIIIVGLFFIVSCETAVKEPAEEEPAIDEEAGFAGITKKQCTNAGGNWNECGSPCAGTDAEICIQVCQVQCECGGIAGFSCPEGYRCRLTGKIADERGVCIKE